jgi:hypothetical protein
VQISQTCDMWHYISIAPSYCGPVTAHHVSHIRQAYLIIAQYRNDFIFTYDYVYPPGTTYINILLYGYELMIGYQICVYVFWYKAHSAPLLISNPYLLCFLVNTLPCGKRAVSQNLQWFLITHHFFILPPVSPIT